MNAPTIQSFNDLGLSPNILQGLQDLGFETPTPIQAEAIPLILKDSRDLLGFAQTGTGKTAAFSLPILEKTNPGDKRVQALILCPTRELCMQITRDIAKFSKHMPKTDVVAIYGGSSMYDQIKKIQAGAQIVVGTPGRVKDLVSRGKLVLDELRFLVLDEADDMLDKGFKDDLDAILDDTPEQKQTLLFSATMSPWIRKVASQRMHDPKEVKVAAQNQGADTVEHEYVTVHARDRYAALRRLLDINPDVYGIVFCRTRRDTKEVAAKLIANNYLAEAIHGDIEQRDRSEVMARFRKGDIQILVATDVAARGIDVNELTHVINYELPDSPETYVHRSGRTGRAGNKGTSITIINMKERGKIRRIESIMRKKFTEIDVPTGKQICEAQLMSLVRNVKTTEVDEKNLAPYLPAIYEALEGLSYQELVQHFVSVEFNRFLQHYSNIPDISTQRGHEPRRDDGRNGGRNDRRQSDGRRDRSGKSRPNVELKSYRIQVGKKEGFNPKALFGMINKNQSLKGIEIGNINIQSSETHFEADAKYHSKLLRFLGREKHKGKDIRLSPM